LPNSRYTGGGEQSIPLASTSSPHIGVYDRPYINTESLDDLHSPGHTYINPFAGGVPAGAMGASPYGMGSSPSMVNLAQRSYGGDSNAEWTSAAYEPKLGAYAHGAHPIVKEPRSNRNKWFVSSFRIKQGNSILIARMFR